MVEAEAPMRIHLSRFVTTAVDAGLERMDQEGAAAAAAGAELVVFPEGFLHGYLQPADPAALRARFRRLSGDHPRTAFLFGTITEAGRNRLTFWEAGEARAQYDKVHLFRPNGEDRMWAPGDRYVAVRFRDWTLGLLTCNDIRFPEQARALRLEAGADALLVPAWWPWRRDHVWRTLLRARAIENAVFTVGCCVAASEWPGEPFSGAGNHVFDPLGDPIPTDDDHTYVLDRARAAAVLVDPRTTHVPISRVDLC